jgi:hypothetical protein
MVATRPLLSKLRHIHPLAARHRRLVGTDAHHRPVRDCHRVREQRHYAQVEGPGRAAHVKNMIARANPKYESVPPAFSRRSGRCRRPGNTFYSAGRSASWSWSSSRTMWSWVDDRAAMHRVEGELEQTHSVRSGVQAGRLGVQADKAGLARGDDHRQVGRLGDEHAARLIKASTHSRIRCPPSLNSCGQLPPIVPFALPSATGRRRNTLHPRPASSSIASRRWGRSKVFSPCL